MIAQLPDGLTVTVLSVKEFREHPSVSVHTALRTVWSGGHLIVYRIRTGQVRPVLYISASPPPELARLVPQLTAEIAQQQHSQASERAAAVAPQRVAAMLAGRGINRKAS